MTPGVAVALTVISPHHDDAALSLGGTIAALQGSSLSVRVINCFTRSGFAHGHTGHSEEAVSRLRGEEDRAFATAVGLSHAVVNLGLRDAALRHPDGLRAIFRGASRPEHPADVEALAAAIRQLAMPQAIAAPLGLGGHLDHLVARDAAMRVGCGVLAFYEDLPYAARCGDEAHREALREVTARVGQPLWPTCLVSAIDHTLKATLLDRYPSQLTDEVRRRVIDYTRALGSERLWATSAFVEWLQRKGGQIDCRSTVIGSSDSARRAGR